MSKIKTLVVGALALAASFVSGSARADMPADATGKVINFNYVSADNQGSLSGKGAQTTLIGSMPEAAWNQSSSKTSGTATMGSMNALNVYDVNTQTSESKTMSLSWGTTLSGCGQYSHCGEGGLTIPNEYYYLHAYCHYRNNGSAASDLPGGDFILENIPFEKYDVYVYFNGNQKDDSGSKTYNEININNVNYIVNSDGSVVEGTGTWGATKQTAPILGTNALIVKDQTSSTFSFKPQHLKFASIAAFQIVDTTPVAKEVTVSGSEVKVSDINSAVEAAGGAAEDVFEVTLSEATSLTFDTTLAFAKAKIIRDGALALISDSEPADYAKFDFNGVTGFITHDWYRFNGKKVIAINFNASNRSEGENNISKALDVDAYGRIWKNVTDANGSTDVPVYDTATQSATEDTATIVWSSANNWQRDNTDAPFLNGYLDDGGNRARVSIESVPFEYYDVVVYGHGDGSKINQVTVNGTDYIADSNGKAVPGSGNWGDSAYQTTAWGKNALLIEKKSGSLSIIGGQNGNGGRGPICAIMIVETQATVKDVDCGTAYDISNANAFTEDIVNLNFATEGGVLTLDEAPARDFNIVSEGAIMVKFGSGVSIDGSIAKLNCNGVEGGVKFVITDGTIPTTAPAAGITYRWEGETALTAIPFAGVAVAGTLEIACQIAVAADAKIEIANSHNSYVFEDGFSLATSQLVIGNNAGSVQNFTQNGGTITLTKEYTGSDTTTLMPLLLAHWDTTCTYNLVGGSITAENGNVMFGRDGKIAMTVGGGDTTAIFKARGISRDARTNPCSLTIAENGIVQLGVGGIDFAEGKKVVLAGGKIEIYDDATITATEATEVTENSTIDIAAEKTLTLNTTFTGEGEVAITGEGTFNAGKLRDFSKFSIGNDITLSIGEDIAEDGEATLIFAGTAPATIKLTKVDGTIETLPIKDGKVSYTPSVAGKACWMDYEFEGNLNNVGTDTTGLSRDGSDFGPDASADFRNGSELYTGTHPYRGATYPTEWTCAIYGSIPEYGEAALIAFGTRAAGLIGLIKGPNATDDTVYLVRTTGDKKYEVLTEMSVPNATTAQHLYAFVKTDKVIEIYLDGKHWKTYNSDTSISFGGGLQIASVHGGVGSTGIVRFDKALFGGDATNETLRKSVIGMMRLYDCVLGPKAMKILSEEFPYVSPNGLFTRTLADGENGAWNETDAWTKVLEGGTEPADVPDDKAMVRIATSDEAATLAINLDEAATTEALELSGNGALTIALAEGKTAGVANSGSTTISAPLTIKYGALSITGGPTAIEEGGSIIFDYSAAPEEFFQVGYIPLTGDIAEQEDGVVTAILPTPVESYLKYSFGYSSTDNSYGITVAYDRQPTTLYLTETTTISDDTLFATEEGGEAYMPRLFEDDVIVVPADITMTIPTTALAVPLTTPIKGAGTIAVTGATLTEAAPLFTVDETWTGAVEFTNTTVTGADLNSYGNENTTVKLTGVVGYLKSGVEFEPEIILENNNLAGLELTDGSSGSTVIFSKVSGTGNFIGNKAGVTQKIAVIDASEHTGQVRMVGGMGVTLGSNAGTVDSAKIAVADGATIAFAGQTWIAEGGVTFGDTLTVVGDVGSYITMPEPAALPAITLAGYNRDYMLKYVDGKLTVAYAEVEVVIPEIAGTTVEVWVSGSEEAITPVEGKVSIPYGADMTVLYIVKEGKLFKNGDYMLPLEYENVTEDPEIANDITEDDVTVDAGARIEDVDYLTITDALDDASIGQTVIVLQNAALESLMVPGGVTLDLNDKTVVAAAIENYGTIIVYDEATVLALIDTHGTIKFAKELVVANAYVFPAETVVTVRKVEGVDGATVTMVTLPDDGILWNLYGAAAKKTIIVTPGASVEGVSCLALGGIIERGSQNTDTIISVGGNCMVVGPLTIGADGAGMDYEKYPNDMAMLSASIVAFQDIYGTAQIKLIPEHGKVETLIKLTDTELVGEDRIVTDEGAKIVETAVTYQEGTVYTYTAEWIKPEATVEAMTDKPEELDAAATFKATEAGASKYADYTASLTITSDKDVAQDAIILAGQFNATDLEDPASINNNYDGEWIDMPLTSDLTAGEPYAVIDMPWNFVTENVKIFNCGLKNIALAEETTFTVTLTIAKDDDTVLTKDIEFTIPAAKILPTADVNEITAEGYEAAVEFTAKEIGQGYENWTAEFILTSDVAIGADEIKLGGQYDAYSTEWVDIAFPGCEAGEEVSVLGLVDYDDITVKTVFDTIQSFKCGVKNIALKNDATFTLKFVITDGETMKEICSIDDLTVAAAITPVKPGEDIKVPEGADPEDFASIVNANLEKYLIVPDVVEDKVAYRSLFAAKVVDGDKVAIMLTDAAKADIADDLKASAGEILTPGEDGKATIAAKPGLYYGIKAVAEIKAMGAAEGQNWVQATGDTVEVVVPVLDSNKAFFKSVCTPSNPIK